MGSADRGLEWFVCKSRAVGKADKVCTLCVRFPIAVPRRGRIDGTEFTGSACEGRRGQHRYRGALEPSLERKFFFPSDGRHLDGRRIADPFAGQNRSAADRQAICKAGHTPLSHRDRPARG